MCLKAAKDTSIKGMLPSYHTVLLRDYFAPMVARRSNIYENRRVFEALHQRILQLMAEIPEEHWDTRVLVPPQFCLDRYSSDFSAIMTVEHILIVGQHFSSLVADMAMGDFVDRLFSIEQMKPRKLKPPQVILAEFEKYAESCMRDLEPLMERASSKQNVEHPWFGPFNVVQWHWLLCGHAMIHYRQLKNIKKLLTPST